MSSLRHMVHMDTHMWNTHRDHKEVLRARWRVLFSKREQIAQKHLWKGTVTQTCISGSWFLHSSCFRLGKYTPSYAPFFAAHTSNDWCLGEEHKYDLLISPSHTHTFIEGVWGTQPLFSIFCPNSSSDQSHGDWVGGAHTFLILSVAALDWVTIYPIPKNQTNICLFAFFLPQCLLSLPVIKEISAEPNHPKNHFCLIKKLVFYYHSIKKKPSRYHQLKIRVKRCRIKKL